MFFSLIWYTLKPRTHSFFIPNLILITLSAATRDNGNCWFLCRRCFEALHQNGYMTW